MKILVISASLSHQSKSRTLAKQAYQILSKQTDTNFLDLRDYPLPLCDGGDSFSHPLVKKLQPMIAAADGILIATPVYNYDVNAALKNMVELTGDVWEQKLVGFLVAAGGKSSYMSVMKFGNSLMFEFRCLIIPRFVYATGEDFSPESNMPRPKIQERINELCTALIKYGKALSAV